MLSRTTSILETFVHWAVYHVQFIRKCQLINNSAFSILITKKLLTGDCFQRKYVLRVSLIFPENSPLYIRIDSSLERNFVQR